MVSVGSISDDDPCGGASLIRQERSLVADEAEEVFAQGCLKKFVGVVVVNIPEKTSMDDFVPRIDDPLDVGSRVSGACPTLRCVTEKAPEAKQKLHG
jgi:hypothetical protein